MTTKANLLKAIRRNCVECFGGQVGEVDGCTSPKCNLYDFRNGIDPTKSKTKGFARIKRISDAKKDCSD